MEPEERDTVYILQKVTPFSILNIFQNGERVDITDQAVHLGIQRNTSGKPDIDGKITLGRNRYK